MNRMSLFLLLAAGLLGCASKGAATRVAAPAANTAAKPQVASPSHEHFRLTAAQEEIPAQQHEDHQPQPGKKLERLPPLPAEPEAIGKNQHQTLHEPLTLELLESLACTNNPTLRQAQAQVEGELGKAIQAGLWPNPTLSYVQEQIGVAGTAGEFAGGAVSQRIVTGRKLGLSRAKFLARTQTSQWQALEQQYRVLNDVRIHFFRTRGRQQLVEIHEELLKSSHDNLLTQRERYNVGQVTRADVHLASAALQRARLDLLRHENEYRLAFEELIALAGVDLSLAPLVTPLEGDTTPIDWNEALERLLVQSPQINAAENKLEADRITMRREMVESMPDLVVEGAVGRNFEAQETVANARLSIEVPLFDWNQGTIRQAEADYVRQQGELRRLELVLKRDLARVYQEYLTALQHVENYQQVILPETRQAYELQLRSYQENRIAWNEVLATQQQYYMTRAEYVRNLAEWREAEVKIVGFLLHDGLNAPLGVPPAGHINSVPKPR